MMVERVMAIRIEEKLLVCMPIADFMFADSLAQELKLRQAHRTIGGKRHGDF
jgi:hypothetical protein